MLTVYPAIIHKEDESYWIEFPDLEGCQTYGSTLQKTLELAQEALGLYLASRLDNNQSINTASDIKSFNLNADTSATYIYCAVDKYRLNTKAVKKTLTIPQWLNEAAESRHINFSSVLKEALIDQLQN